jgi:hypothetical protein
MPSTLPTTSTDSVYVKRVNKVLEVNAIDHEDGLIMIRKKDYILCKDYKGSVVQSEICGGDRVMKRTYLTQQAQTAETEKN